MTAPPKINRAPPLESQVVENFVSFFTGEVRSDLGLSELQNDYHWKIPLCPFDEIEGWPTGSSYEANVRLKLMLHKLWLDKKVDRLSLARWVISDWGGVRGNLEQTLLRYVDMAERHDPATPINGVASYSKLLSVAMPVEYAIYDARVAVALNAAQVLMRKPGIAFPYLPGRNKITGDRVNKRGFSQMEEFSSERLEQGGWMLVPPSAAYKTYIQLLAGVRSRLSKTVPLYDFEMTLFSQAERLALAVEPSLVPVSVVR